MFKGIDANTHEEVTPNNSYFRSLYFIAFIIIGCFYMVNLFVGVLIDTYEKEKENTNKSAFVTSEQRAWIDASIGMFKAIPQPPSIYTMEGAKEQRFMADVVNSDAFNTFIVCVIVLNVIVLMSDSYPPSSFSDVLEGIDTFCALIFLIECALKIGAQSFAEYMSSNWNRWDFMLVLISVPGIIASYMFDVSTRFTSTFRLLRIMRLLRVSKSAKSVHNLMRTFIVTLPSLSNISGVLFLVFFVFAVIAVAMFGSLKRQTSINRNANFESFSFAILTLFRMTTGESWHEIMNDCSVKSPQCNLKLGECGFVSSRLFFILFILLGMHVLLNLFIAVMMDAFDSDYATKVEGDLMNPTEVETFFAAWTHYDSSYSYKISMCNIPLFMDDITKSTKFGFPPSVMTLHDKMIWMAHLNVMSYDDEVPLIDLMTALAVNQCGHILGDRQRRKLLRRIERFRNKYHLTHVDGVREVNVAVTYVAIKIQRWWRGLQARRTKSMDAIQKKKSDTRIRGKIMKMMEKDSQQVEAQSAKVRRGGVKVYTSSPPRGGKREHNTMNHNQTHLDNTDRIVIHQARPWLPTAKKPLLWRGLSEEKEDDENCVLTWEEMQAPFLARQHLEAADL